MAHADESPNTLPRFITTAFCVMKDRQDWKQFWEVKAAPGVSDFEFDRGTAPRDSELDLLSNRELLCFIGPQASDVVLDAGCGTGANILLLQSVVGRIIAMDYSGAAVMRCRKRLAPRGVANVRLLQGDVCSIPLAARSADRILCMSVLHYLTDDQVRATLRDFRRVLSDGGTLILHVKNLASLYLCTLWLMKRLLLFLGRETRLENFRTFSWYARELQGAGFKITAYNSFNIFVVEKMPRKLVIWLQRMELAHRDRFPLRLPFLRRRGADLKLRATVRSAPITSPAAKMPDV